MPKSMEAIYVKLKNAGLSTDVYFEAVQILDKAGQGRALKAASALNRERDTAVTKLAALVEKTRAKFQAPPFGDERAATVLERIHDEVDALRTTRRRSGVDLIIRTIERHTPVGARHMGELAAKLSDQGISYSEQAMLLLAKLPGKSKVLRARKTGETEKKAVQRLRAQLKIAGSRSRDHVSEKDNMKLIADVFPDLFPKRKR